MAYRPAAWFASLIVVLCAAALARPAAALNAIDSQNGLDVIAVGDSGLVYRSWNGGVLWTRFALGAQPLRGVVQRGFTLIAVGDSGRIWRSVDNGGSWSLRVVAGAPSLRAISMPTDSVGFVVGGGGLVLATNDAGASWILQFSGVAARLNAVRFRDAARGWAVGEGGTAIRTADGGRTWVSVATGTGRSLYGVDFDAQAVWIVGGEATARRSSNQGASWTPVDLRLDSRSDVNLVWLDAGRAILSGGGGFLRETSDGGATWTFRSHLLMNEIAAITFLPDGATGWACARNKSVVLRTTNRGLTWSLPSQNLSSSVAWSRRAFTNAQVRGTAISPSGLDRNVFYAALGESLYRSLDRGESWLPFGRIPSVTKTNALIVSPRNPSLMVAAVGVPDRIVRSTDHGATWSGMLQVDFGEYGVPLEMDPDRPDTLLFAPEDGNLWRSVDFGATWSVLSSPGFRSPCDIAMVPDDPGNVWVADGVTGIGDGEIWQSLDGGLTFEKRWPGPGQTGGSEVPNVAASRLDNRLGFATHWPNAGITRTTDGGRTWQRVLSGASAWGVEVARDDPGVVVSAVFGGSGGSYFSFDRGASFSFVPLPQPNYALRLIDRATMLAQQADGIHKLQTDYYMTPVQSQTMLVTAPGAGEVLRAGTEELIQWLAANVYLVRIEYRRAPGAPWQLIAVAPGVLGHYWWLVPDDPTTQAAVRVSDAWDADPADISRGTFTIAAPRIVLAPASIDFGSVPVGGAALDSVVITNPGTGFLVVSSVASNDPAFAPGRSSFSIPPGKRDTVGVAFRPAARAAYSATLQVDHDAPGGPVLVSLAGRGIAPVYAIGSDLVEVGATPVGVPRAGVLTLRNPGDAPLVVSSVTSSRPSFQPARTALTIPPLGSDTLGVWFTPAAIGPDSALITLEANDELSPHGVRVTGRGLPTSVTLDQNRPNPFRASTVIRYTLPVATTVSLEIFNLLGQRVATLVKGPQTAGEYEVPFGPGAPTIAGLGARALPSGVYFYRLEAPGFSATRKMLLIR